MKRAIVITICLAGSTACSSGSGDPASATPVCTELYAAGVTLPADAEDRACVAEDGDEVMLANVFYSCDNGDELVGNQYGVSWLASDRVVFDLDLTDPAADEISAACGDSG